MAKPTFELSLQAAGAGYSTTTDALNDQINRVITAIYDDMAKRASDAALQAEVKTRADKDNEISAQANTYTVLGSLLTPAGVIGIPAAALTLICRSTVTNRRTVWRKGDAPSDEVETDVLVKDGGEPLRWWQKLKDLDADTLIKDLANLEAEGRDGRSWAPEGSLLSPQGLKPPIGTTVIICRTTGNVSISFWRTNTPPADGIIADDWVPDANGQWWRLIWRSTTATVANKPAPHLMQFLDAKGAAYGLYDKASDISTTIGPVSVRAHLQRIKQNLESLSGDARKGLHLNLISDLGCSQHPSAAAHNSKVINAALQKFARNREAFGHRAVFYVPDGHDIPLEDYIVPVNGASFVGGDRSSARFMPYSYRAAFFRAPTWPYTVTSRNWLEDVTFSNFTIECENQIQRGPNDMYVGTKGTYFHGYRRTYFLNVNCFNSGMTGLGNDFADHVLYHNCHVVNGGRHPRGAGGGSGWDGAPGSSGIGLGSGWLPEEVQGVVNCTIEDCWNYGTFVEKQANNLSATNISKGAFFIGNTARNNRRGGIGEAGCYDTIIASNQIMGSDQQGIVVHAGTISSGIAGQRTQITGNVIANCGGDGIHYDTAGKASIHGFHTNGNIIDGCENGISIVGYPGAAIDDFALRNDDISNCRKRAIDVVSGRFTNFDIMLPRLLNNGRLAGGTNPAVGGGIRLGAEGETTYIRRGRIFGATISDVRSTPTQLDSIVGAADLGNFSIKDVDGFGCGPVNLTGPSSNVTITDNIGV